MSRCDKKLDGILKKILDTKLKHFGIAIRDLGEQP
jgi:hypothetical protein